MHEAYIASAVRTPIGSLLGTLAGTPATKLGSIVIKEAIHRADIRVDDIEEVIIGNVVSAGLGQNPARQAALGAGLPDSVGATTVNKVCGSGLKAVIFATQALHSSDANIIIAGGIENMSLAPYILYGARKGYRVGNAEIVDSMIKDGLWDVYADKHMGGCGEMCAERYGFSRKDQDDFAIRSYLRAIDAQRKGYFREELVPVTISKKNGEEVIMEDEEPGRFDEEKLRKLNPAFKKEGTVTAGNASSINDGAAAVTVISDRLIDRSETKPLARIIGYASAALTPEWFTIAPITAIRTLFEKTGLTKNDIDLFEINEAFAGVTMAAEKEIGLDPERVNINGGAVALGHPIGASGTRILVTLIHALKRTGGKKGIVSLCIGGGEAIAMAIEMV